MVEPLVPLGEIVASHGLLGWLKLNPFNQETTALKPGTEVFLDHLGGQSAHQLETSSPYKQHQWLIKLRDVNGIDDAAKYIGSTLSVMETALEPLGTGQYYHYQVIGFEVVTVSGDRIGAIQSTLSTAAGELYLVRDDGKEHLIPAVKEIIERIDFASRTMTINPPAGLLDL